MQDASPHRRRWALVLPVVVTVLLGAGVGGYVVLESQRQSDRIEAADDLAADYLSDVATYRAEIAKALKEADADSPASLRRALRTAAADPPELGTTDQDAMEQSTTYAEAQRVAETLLDPYRGLARALKKAQADQAFVGAATEVLQLRASDYVDGTVISSSAQVRGSLIPTFVKARDEFAAVDVPKGAEQAAELTRVAIQSVIDGATALADSIDAGRAYTFSYGDEHAAALTAVDDFAARADGDFVEAVNAVKDLG